MKIDTCHVDHLTWQKPEWADEDSEALIAHHAGYELEIGRSREWANKFDWSCRMTAAISETPELVDCGTAASVSGAKRGAGTAANNSMRRRAKVAHAEKAKPEPKPEPEPEKPTGGEMLEAVEADVKKAVAKPRQGRKQEAAA